MEKAQILIVDDEPANQFLLDGLLQENGFDVIAVSSGIECLDTLKNCRPDLILMDIMMPKMTGIEALREISKDEKLKQIPVLMVSAKTSTEDIKEALELGAIDYIKKPFDEIELLARIHVGLRIKFNEDQLRQMIAQRNDFVRIISHDLRSPFTAIHGLAELLLPGENLTPDQKESIGYIIESIQFSNDYFNKLLNWAMLESHDLKLSIERYRLKELIGAVFSIFEKKAIAKNIVLENLVSESFEIEIDKTFFRQVLANLINNSIKFTNTNGTIKCSSKSLNEGFQISIIDNGVGMPEGSTPESLFSQYAAKSQRGTQGEKGTGIGLQICNKILNAHNFNFTFRRLSPSGTEFIISSK
jgi:two-component system sensor histidine kinase/response regulator